MEMIINVLQRAMVAATPLFLATLGEIYCERAGILNLGIEGMMAVGAMTGFVAALTTGSLALGLIAAILAGALLSLIHSFTSVTLRANQTVSGLALTMLGLGISGLWGKPFIGIPLGQRFTDIRIPLLADIPLIGPVFFDQDLFFYLAILLGILSWFLLNKTTLGVKIRSVGENPKAAEAQGVNVFLVKYLCITIGGALAGMAGAHLSLAYSSSWIEGMTGGRGWIAVALTIFALWNPVRALWGSLLFGGIFVLQYLLQPLGISPNLLGMLPYITTLVVLGLDGLRKDHHHFHSPATLGEVYIRGER